MSTVSLLGRARLFMSSRQPLLKASLTSGGIMMLGDVLAQKMAEDRRKRCGCSSCIDFAPVGAPCCKPKQCTPYVTLQPRLASHTSVWFCWCHAPRTLLLHWYANP